MDDIITCTPKFLPAELQLVAAERAVSINPANRPLLEMAAEILKKWIASQLGLPSDCLPETEDIPQPEFLVAVTSKFWGTAGVKLTTSFLDSPPVDLQRKIISYLNRWNEHCNVEFVASNVDPMVRIARARDGYWSYLGTDILSIPRGEPTMSLQDFTLSTPDSEFERVVPHEGGHSMGFPHEHSRKEIIDKLDPGKVYGYYRVKYGWSAATVRQQILTPLEQSSLLMPEMSSADVHSIMAYEFPGDVTRDGRPIPGGRKIDAEDAAYAAKIYPKPAAPPPPPPPPAGYKKTVVIDMEGDAPIKVTVRGA